MRFPCWILKDINTHPEYAILIPFPLQQWLHKCASIFRFYFHYFLYVIFPTSLSVYRQNSHDGGITVWSICGMMTYRAISKNPRTRIFSSVTLSTKDARGTGWYEIQVHAVRNRSLTVSSWDWSWCFVMYWVTCFKAMFFVVTTVTVNLRCHCLRCLFNRASLW